MSTQTFNKRPLTFQDQLALLKSRGLEINDESRALHYLSEISYYRLSAYFSPYQSEKDSFNKNTSFNHIITTYTFDRELRLLVFDCIERIEIAIRTQFIYTMSVNYNDSHWQDNQAHFITPYTNKIGRLVDPFSDFQAIIAKAKKARTPENFIKYYTKNYQTPVNPPSWMCVELLTVGELSHLYRGLKNNSDKKRIADFFDVHHTVFTSWLHTLTYIRNICAHHSRLWNRDLAIEPEKLLKPKGNWVSQPFENNKRVFYFLCILRYMLLRANPTNTMASKIKSLFSKYPTIPIQFLGIPSDGKGNIINWQNEPLWRQ
jgi:abortive infection bacteriophage resistance protein